MGNRLNNIPHSISILQRNANGLACQKNELHAFLSINSIDILLICEARLTPNSSFNISSYTKYQSNHPDGSAHAGSAILLKSNIKRTILPPYQNNVIQSTNILLTLNHIPTTISSTSIRPGAKLNPKDFDHFFNSLGNHFLAGRDFNAKHPRWGFSQPNSRGRTLKKFILDHNRKIIFAPPPTYWPSHANRQPIQKYNSDRFHKYLESISNADNSLRKATKSILKEKRKIPPLRYPDNYLASSNHDKANLFVSDLEDRFSPHPNLLIRNQCSNIEALLLNTLPLSQCVILRNIPLLLKS